MLDTGLSLARELRKLRYREIKDCEGSEYTVLTRDNRSIIVNSPLVKFTGSLLSGTEIYLEGVEEISSETGIVGLGSDTMSLNPKNRYFVIVSSEGLILSRMPTDSGYDPDAVLSGTIAPGTTLEIPLNDAMNRVINIIVRLSGSNNDWVSSEAVLTNKRNEDSLILSNESTSEYEYKVISILIHE